MQNEIDLNSYIKVSRGLSPAAIITGNGTSTTQIIDRQGFDSLCFVFAAGAVTDGTWTVTIFEDSDPAMATETAVAAADLIGLASGASTFTIATGQANTVKKVGYKGSKRYLRAKAVQAGATTGGFLAVVALQSSPAFAPVP